MTENARGKRSLLEELLFLGCIVGGISCAIDNGKNPNYNEISGKYGLGPAIESVGHAKRYQTLPGIGDFVSRLSEVYQSIVASR